jgi:potassium efflux system protein
VISPSNFARPGWQHAFRAAACALLLVAVPVPAQDDSPIPRVPNEGTVSSEQIETAIAAVESRDGLVEEVRARIIEELRDAQSQLQSLAASKAATEAFTESLTSAPAETEALQAELAAPVPPPPTAESMGITADTSSSELEQELARKRAALASAETALADLEAEIAATSDRPTEARERIEQLRKTRAQLEQVLSATPTEGENPLLAEARKLATELRLDARAAELSRLEQELLSQNVRLELLKAQRDLKTREVTLLRREVAVIQEATNAARQDVAAKLLRDAAIAELAAADKHPVVRELAAETVALGAELPPVVANIQRTTKQLENVEVQAREIEKLLEISQQRLEVGGVSQAIGRLFVEERRNLPQVAQYRQHVRERRRELADIGLAQVQIEERRRALTPVDQRVDELMTGVVETVDDEAELTVIRAEIQKVLNSRRALLREMASSYTTYLRALSDLDVAERRLLDTANEYKNFLDQHLLWIPSASVVGVATFRDLGEATQWALSPQSWVETIRVLMISLKESILYSLLAIFLVAAMLFLRHPLRQKRQSINERVGRLSTDSIWLTVGALGIAVAMALPVPLALWATGRFLQESSAATAFSNAVAAGLLATAPFFYNVRLFRIICGPRGVMRTHFGWHESSLAIIRRQLDFLVAVGVPIVFVAVMMFWAPLPAMRDSLGRLAFVGLMAVFTLVAIPLSNPKTGIAHHFYAAEPRRLTSRLRWLWHGLAVGIPLLLIGLVLLGYIYTAATLTRQIIDTIWLVLGVVVLNLVVLRWLSLARRKILLERALEARAARKANKDATDTGEPMQAEEGGEGPPIAERKPMDLDAVDQQTRRLLQSALFVLAAIGGWGIWSEILPALGILEEVSLWTETVTIDGSETQVPITLADLLLGFVAAIVTWVASRNLPGLLEIAVLRHLELEPGGRYTIITLVRYIVVTIGVIVVLNVIGWSWSRIQWLVAALSVGLGFGLQEIVANFVSGLIILFERPVRVGDTVTVGNLTGTVSKVRIRATTITDWDRKEIIVPNKAFITDQVVNWTLSDPITRITIDVGISYGSDVTLAHQVIEDTLRKQPLILDDPEPRAYFTGFGDSSLNFRLYVYSRQLSDRLPLTNVVHHDIFQALKDNGIEIPFPQRDLHVRSISPGVRWEVGETPADKGD